MLRAHWRVSEGGIEMNVGMNTTTEEDAEKTVEGTE
jgi:hypothetical protein